MKNRAIFILSYKRAHNVMTYNYLKNCGCKMPIYIIVDDKDEELNEYTSEFENVLVYSKAEWAKKTDSMDNFGKMNKVVFVRNACFELAKQNNIDSFLVLDDDYNQFNFRRPNDKGELKSYKVVDIDKVFNICFDYLENTPLIDCFALSQSGDFICGALTFDSINFKRKIMNSFFCRADRPVKFLGSINEDLNASVYGGQRGKYYFTINDCSVNQAQTQAQTGGLTDIYLDLGTYVKSFYSVICAPNCVKISVMGNTDYRIHHKVHWNMSAPKLLREIHKKQ